MTEEQHNDLYKMVAEIHRLLLGDPADPSSEGLKQIVQRHERAIRTVQGAMIFLISGISGALIVVGVKVLTGVP